MKRLVSSCQFSSFSVRRHFCLVPQTYAHLLGKKKKKEDFFLSFYYLVTKLFIGAFNTTLDLRKVGKTKVSQ